jgi:hypothetical protein
MRQGFGPKPDMFIFFLIMLSGAIILFHVLPWVWAMVVAMPLVAVAWVLMCAAAHYAGFVILFPGLLLAGILMLVRTHPPWVLFAALPLLVVGGFGTILTAIALVLNRREK